MKITDIQRYQLSDLISHYSEGNLSEDACDSLAYFLDDVFHDGIELNRLMLIAQESKEYSDLNELAHGYLGNEEIAEIEAETDDFEQDIIEKIEEDYSVTIVRTDEGFVVIE